MFPFNLSLKLSYFKPFLLIRNFSRQSKCFEHLKNRTVLRLSGPDTSNYIQNMITNDIKRVEDCPTLYSLFLNPQGRVVYDLLLYKLFDDEFLVEYDSTGAEHLHRHLLMYRLRKKVKIEPLTNKSVWAVYKSEEDNDKPFYEEVIHNLKGQKGVISVARDPRIDSLGVRILSDKGVDLQEPLSSLGALECDQYQTLRYRLGIGEGVMDHPPGNCLPFETNIDLLNGVSFTKGCYLGQEMTAKSNFVLSIRKRLMPVVLDDRESYPMFPPECNVLNEKQQKVGRLRNHVGRYGLALLKYEDALKSDSLQMEGFDIRLKAIKPKWWPENLSSDKNEHIRSI